MDSWSKYPFLRMLIPLGIGVWWGGSVSTIGIPIGVLPGVMVTLLAMAAMATFFVKRYRLQWLFGGIMACYLLFAGYSLIQVHQDRVHDDYFRSCEDEADYYVARVFDYPMERENSVKVVLELKSQYSDSNVSRQVTGKVMAYFQKSDASMELAYGDLLLIPAPVAELSGPANPGEFDYRNYLNHKGMNGQLFLRDKDWMGLKVNEANPLYAFSYRFRDILLESLQRCGLSGDEFGVTAAILLGYDDDLADEVRKNYVAAGSMHILCVSGMHVGIIYLLASALLGLLNRKKWMKVFKQFLLLFLIWFYAMIAGLSPSILRSALMISFVIVGDVLQRKGFAINSIAASAFVLLCVNPFNLFEIGFQLSYAAVIGIVVLQRPIYGWLCFRNKLADKIWEITAVALAAQIATIPFTLFYFNQFTTYFWLSNLFMTPISFVVIMGGMILLLVSWIPFLNVFVGRMVWGLVYVMNFLVGRVERIPFALIKGLYVNGFEFFLLLVVFVLILVGAKVKEDRVTKREQHIVIMVLSVLLVFSASLLYRVYSHGRQDGMVVYSLRKHTAIDCILGNEHVLLADTSLLIDKSAVDYSLTGFWAQRSLSPNPVCVGFDEDFKNDFVEKRSNLISFGGKLMVLWDEKWFSDSLSYRIPADYVLVTGKQKPDVVSVMRGYEVGRLLIDGSVPVYLAEKWKSQADEAGLPYYNIADGALVLE